MARTLLAFLVVINGMLLIGCTHDSCEPASEAHEEPTLKFGTEAAYAFLAREQDRYHNTFVIYDDRDSGAAHFFPSGWMGDLTAVPADRGKGIIDDASLEQPRSGNTCIKVSIPQSLIRDGTRGWVGVYWQFPDNNWGGQRGQDLSRYMVAGASLRLTFWARGLRGGEYVQFLSGGIQRTPNPGAPRLPYSDSFGPTYPERSMRDGLVRLCTSWRQYTIDLTGKDAGHLIGAFCWAAQNETNRGGLTFFLDDISIELGQAGTALRLAEPRFIRSYVTQGGVDPDAYFRNVCYSYDNAVALLAFLARGNADDKRRAKLIADAFVIAVETDRAISDGRLRNGYCAGDLLDPVKGWARIPGWWDDWTKGEKPKWVEDIYPVSSDCGNMGWAMLALLGYWEHADRHPDSRYLKTVVKMGKWIECKCRSDTAGYRGGWEGWCEDDHVQIPLTWKSTEHNIDLAVAFERLHLATGDPKWLEASRHARKFVESMWDETEGHFWTGTERGSDEINKKPIPLDVQAWAILALRDRRYARGIEWALTNCAITGTPAEPGQKGFDFKNDQNEPRELRGIWWEGTAQMQLALRMLGDTRAADQYLESLREFASPVAAHGGVVATSLEELWTGYTKEQKPKGFQWKYYRRPHIGATSWYLFAERGWNPYWSEPIIPLPAAAGSPASVRKEAKQ